MAKVCFILAFSKQEDQRLTLSNVAYVHALGSSAPRIVTPAERPLNSMSGDEYVFDVDTMFSLIAGFDVHNSTFQGNRPQAGFAITDMLLNTALVKLNTRCARMMVLSLRCNENETNPRYTVMREVQVGRF